MTQNSANSQVNKLAKPGKPGTLVGMKSNDLQGLFGSYKAMIAQALPRHLTAERMISLAVNSITQNPALAECSVPSVIGSIMQASILGFNPAPALGYCYLVPYNRKQPDGSWVKECQFQIGYRGYIDLARRSGEIKMIYAEVVREGDLFDFELGLNPKLDHKPSGKAGNPRITHSYAVVHYKDGGYNFIVLTRAEIDSLRLRSPGQKNPDKGTGVWATDFPAMAKAKAIKQMAKYMPLTEEHHSAVSTDGATIQTDNFSKDGTGLDATQLDYANVQETESVEFQEVDGQRVDTKTGEVLQMSGPNSQNN